MSRRRKTTDYTSKRQEIVFVYHVTTLFSYRSTGSLTAIPTDELDPVRLVRGGRLRWRPKKISQTSLEHLAEEDNLPIVFEDKAGTINVAVSMIQKGYLIAPSREESEVPEDTYIRKISQKRGFAAEDLDKSLTQTEKKGRTT